MGQSDGLNRQVCRGWVAISNAAPMKYYAGAFRCTSPAVMSHAEASHLGRVMFGGTEGEEYEVLPLMKYY